MPETPKLTKEQSAVLFLIIIVAISLAIAVLKFLIWRIHFYQNMFWIFLVFIPIFGILSVFFLIWSILKKEEVNSDSWNLEHSFFDFSKPLIFSLCIISLLLMIFSFFGMIKSYEEGYSEEALEKLAEYESQLQSLQQLKDVFTGQIIWDITDQAVEETINNLCKDPNYPCDSVKQSYESYKSVKGAKDTADDVANFLGLMDNVKNSN